MPATIADTFSAMAASYDAYAAPQLRAAGDLLAFTSRPAARAILEPGCGTGLYTRLLLDAFPGATVLGLDIAAAMVATAQWKITDPRATFRMADAETFAEGRYDLITANATVQWFTDLPGSLRRLAGRLAPGGTLSFSYFGPETYRELDDALREVCGEEARVACRRFADAEAVADSLAAACPHWAVDARTYTQTFPTLKDLLTSIKFTGTRGRHQGPSIAWTPRRLARLEEVYRARVGEIRASYQVLLCRGQA